MTLTTFVLSIVAIEAITELLVNARILDKPRLYLASRSKFLKELIECPYCLSLWVAIAVFYTHFIIICIISLHRLSNVFHSIINKYVRIP